MSRRRGSFDFETYGWKGGEEIRALCCGLKAGDDEVFFHDSSRKNHQLLVEKVLLYMHSRTDVHEWWAHAMGAFDGLQLIGAALRLGWNAEAILAGQSRVIGVTLWPPGSEFKVSCKDLYAVVQARLKDIARDFDLPSRKLFDEADYRGDMRDLPVEKLRAGCMADCRIVVEALEVVENLLGQWGGELRSTFSGSALTVAKAHLRKAGYRMQLHREGKPYADANRTARAGYYGARVEVLDHHPEDVLTEFDVCSSYPWSMSQKDLPWRYEGQLSGGAAVHAFNAKLPGVYHAKVIVPEMWLPPLPYRAPSGLFFPTGTWDAWFPAIELDYAKTLGVSVDVKAGVIYSGAEPFSDFIAQVYETKRNSKGALRTFAKLLLNGCYGKWAEKPDRQRLYVAADEWAAEWYMQDHEGTTQLDPDGDPRLLAVAFEKYAPHAHYALGSYITAHSRILLHKYLGQAIRPAYCDTDSIHCVAWEGGPTGDALGQLKIELEGYIGRFYAPKIYAAHDPKTDAYLTKLNPDGTRSPLIACKGFPVTAEDFEKMLASARRVQELERRGMKHAKAMDSVQGVLHTRTRLLKSQLKGVGGEASTKVMRVETEKVWAGLSMKRSPYPDGTTRPWSVGELESKAYRKARCPIL